MIRSTKVRVLLLAVVSTALQQACKSDSSTSPDSVELSVHAVSPTNFDGIVGTVAEFSPTIQVIDARTKRPVAKVPVDFIGGSVSSPVVYTDAEGIASAGVWRFSTKAGTERLEARIGDLLKLHFTATLTHDVPTDIRVSDGGELVGLAGHRVAGFGLQVVDQFGNGVPDVHIAFAVSSGTIAIKSAITDRGGGAFAGDWLLDEAPGTGELTITADGVKPKVLIAEGIDPATLRWYKLQEYHIGNDISPASGLDAQARFGLTVFDKCLCGTQQGFFIDEVAYSPDQVNPVQYGGRYQLVGAILKLPSTFSPSAFIKGDSLFIDRIEFGIPFLFDDFVRTWVYREITD